MYEVQLGVMNKFVQVWTESFGFFFRFEAKGFRLGVWVGYCPPPSNSLYQAIYNHIISIIQLLLRGAVPKVWGSRFTGHCLARGLLFWIHRCGSWASHVGQRIDGLESLMKEGVGS